MKYNFAIIEDNLEIRKEISEYFSQSQYLECVMAVDSVQKFIKFHRDFLEIKLVLLDVMLGNQSSIFMIPHIKQREPDAEIIMFTISDDSNVIFQALTYGATGYLLKDIGMPELEKMLYDVLEGKGALLSPSVAKKIIRHFVVRDAVPVTEADRLTEKEKVVMHLLKDGLPYEEMAQRMGLSINGVRYYIKSVYRKLQVKSRGELVRKHFLE